MKFVLALICILLLNTVAVNAMDSPPDYSKGPLYGKNLFIPFLIHYNFPSLPAKSGERYDLQYHLSMYYVQDIQSIMDDTFIDAWT